MIMTDRISYSIIIPHYNTPSLLVRCLNSIPIRNDIEILIIDDCSDKAIVDYENFPGLNRFNAKIFYMEERYGAGKARNVGLANANGKWLLFCDSDDFFAEGFLNVIDKYKETDVDIVFFNITSKYSDSLLDAYRHMRVNRLIHNASSKKIHDIKKLKYSFLEPFAKLYNHNFIKNNKILFDEVFFSNDTIFTLSAAIYAKNIKVDTTPVYCVTVSHNSLTNIISKDSLKVRINIAIRANNILKNNNEKKYKISLIPFIISSRKHGYCFMFRTIIFLLKNNQNLFIGFYSLIINLLQKFFNPTYRHHSKIMKKYNSTVS